MYRAPACFVLSRNLQQARATCWCRGLYQISRTLAISPWRTIRMLKIGKRRHRFTEHRFHNIKGDISLALQKAKQTHAPDAQSPPAAAPKGQSAADGAR